MIFATNRLFVATSPLLGRPTFVGSVLVSPTDLINTNMDAKKKIALVTGGSRGLGKNMALAIAKKGFDVVLTYHSQQGEAEAVVDQIAQLGQQAAALQLDTGT